jgi:hypothetical protein
MSCITGLFRRLKSKRKGSVRENVMFLRDAVCSSERFMATKRKAHLGQEAPADRRALAAETSNLERTLSDLVNQAYGWSAPSATSSTKPTA